MEIRQITSMTAAQYMCTQVSNISFQLFLSEHDRAGAIVQDLSKSHIFGVLVDDPDCTKLGNST